MFESILAGVATGGLSTIFGGVTGLIGTWLTKRAEERQREQDLRAMEIRNDHEAKMKQEDAKIMRLEWEGRNQVAMTEAQSREGEADAAAFTASFNNEPKMYSSPRSRNGFVRFLLGVLDFVRGSMRPFLTVYLCVLVSMIYWEIESRLQAATDIDSLVVTMVHTFLYLFTTCALWWFGTRNKQKPPVIVK